MSSVPRNPSSGSGPDQPDPWWVAGTHPDPDDPLLLEHLGVVVPDDASALDAERRALLRPKRDAWHQRPQLLAVTVTLSLLTVTIALAGALLGVITPAPVPATRPGSYALAAHPAQAPGAVGGLLPDTGLRVDDAIGVSAQNLRPAVLFMPPAGACPTCSDALRTLNAQAREYGLRVYAVSTVDSTDATRALLRDAETSSAHLLTDPAGALTAAFRGPAARAVLVHADGLVGRILEDPSPRGRFEQLLSPLRVPGEPSSLRPTLAAH